MVSVKKVEELAAAIFWPSISCLRASSAETACSALSRASLNSPVAVTRSPWMAVRAGER